MDGVDGSSHYHIESIEDTPSLLTVILDTNPRAWANLSNSLPLSKAIANIIVYLNSHLALSSNNQVAVIASHNRRALWLYPPPAPTLAANAKRKADDPDIDMPDASSPPKPPPTQQQFSPSKFPHFAAVEITLLASIRGLISSTTEADLSDPTTLTAGALTLALAHINKTALALPGTKTSTNPNAPRSTNTTANHAFSSGDGQPSAADDSVSGLHARILIISVSDSSAAQYIPTMNAVFAAAHSHIAIDVLALQGAPTFLQQASYITHGTFIEAKSPQGLLAYLVSGLPPTARRADAAALVGPGAATVDFRAACFCHRKVVDTGFVCSICLSIFCEVPEGAECLTCGTILALGNYGAKPAVVPRLRKKKRRRLDGERADTASEVATPAAG